MINVRQKKCDCGTIASFNYKGLQPLFCKKCKEKDMIELRGTKCFCKTHYASFNFEGMTPQYCSLCKKEGMICLNVKKCKNEGCNTEGNKKYKNYCTHCFQYLFPQDPLTFQIRCKTKEVAVRDFINSNFEGFHHDKPLEYGGCDCLNRRRIDHRKLINNTLFCIETDENQHKSYNLKDEQDRYNDLLSTFTCKYIFIRFNPDSYNDKNGKKNPSGDYIKLGASQCCEPVKILKEKDTRALSNIFWGTNTEKGCAITRPVLDNETNYIKYIVIYSKKLLKTI
jgi:hypothetical protein